MTSAAAFTLAIGSAMSGTLLARTFAIRIGFMSFPNPIVAQHRRPVAYLGGAGVFTGYMAAATCVSLGNPATFSLAMHRFALPAFLFLILGISDDLKAFSFPLKFGLQCAIAVISVLLGNRFGNSPEDVCVSTLWILTLVNAYNFIDVCDGLAAGVSVIGLAALAFHKAAGGIHPLAACGATLGFLVFNFPPASIFLGDAGSHLLGFLIASFSMTLVGDGRVWPYGPEIILISAVPLFELVFITCVRIRKHIPWWRGSPDHFSLRLQAIGLTRLQSDLCGWSVAALAAVAGLSLEYLSTALCLWCISTALVILIACAGLLFHYEPH